MSVVRCNKPARKRVAYIGEYHTDIGIKASDRGDVVRAGSCSSWQARAGGAALGSGTRVCSRGGAVAATLVGQRAAVLASVGGVARARGVDAVCGSVPRRGDAGAPRPSRHCAGGCVLTLRVGTGRSVTSLSRFASLGLIVVVPPSIDWVPRWTLIEPKPDGTGSESHGRP